MVYGFNNQEVSVLSKSWLIESQMVMDQGVEMSIRSVQNEGRYLFFLKMFVTEEKKGEMEIVHKA